MQVSERPDFFRRHEGQRSNSENRCYVVEEVTGRTLYTSWDKEEAIQLANRLVMSGRETRNAVAVRQISCSLLPAPFTERGVRVPKLGTPGRRTSLFHPFNASPTMDYRIEKLPSPDFADMGSIKRVREGDHYIVYIAKRGCWDASRERYLAEPSVLEIWHPAR